MSFEGTLGYPAFRYFRVVHDGRTDRKDLPRHPINLPCVVGRARIHNIFALPDGERRALFSGCGIEQKLLLSEPGIIEVALVLLYGKNIWVWAGEVVNDHLVAYDAMYACVPDMPKVDSKQDRLEYLLDVVDAIVERETTVPVNTTTTGPWAESVAPNA